MAIFSTDLLPLRCSVKLQDICNCQWIGQVSCHSWTQTADLLLRISKMYNLSFIMIDGHSTVIAPLIQCITMYLKELGEGKAVHHHLATAAGWTVTPLLSLVSSGSTLVPRGEKTRWNYFQWPCFWTGACSFGFSCTSCPVSWSFCSILLFL